MSKRSWMSVVEDFGGYKGYMEHAKGVPVDENGEVIEMQGELENLFKIYYGSDYKPNVTQTEKQLRQQLTLVSHFHPENQKMCLQSAQTTFKDEMVDIDVKLLTADEQADITLRQEENATAANEQFCLSRTKRCLINTPDSNVCTSCDDESQRPSHLADGEEEETQQLVMTDNDIEKFFDPVSVLHDDATATDTVVELTLVQIESTNK